MDLRWGAEQDTGRCRYELQNGLWSKPPASGHVPHAPSLPRAAGSTSRFRELRPCLVYTDKLGYTAGCKAEMQSNHTPSKAARGPTRPLPRTASQHLLTMPCHLHTLQDDGDEDPVGCLCCTGLSFVVTVGLLRSPRKAHGLTDSGRHRVQGACVSSPGAGLGRVAPTAQVFGVQR